ncbi:hypothetical protein ACIGO8_10885 [Streptomyces sp. NPDC053493]|uniref:hypothetical protein n=1 Tax=Streptomyces sp. NPDC053493 TaxID=3365705 RepID=UPI0037D83BC4
MIDHRQHGGHDRTGRHTRQAAGSTYRITPAISYDRLGRVERAGPGSPGPADHVGPAGRTRLMGGGRP